MFQVRMKGPGVDDLVIELGPAPINVGSADDAAVKVAALLPRHFSLQKTREGVAIVLTRAALRERVWGTSYQQLTVGKAARFGPFTLTVEPEAIPGGEERALLERIQTGDDARLVYADWLEERGRNTQADYVRAEVAANKVDPLTARFEARSRNNGPDVRPPELQQLAELKARVGPAFRAQVARRSIEGCALDWDFKCPKTWNALALTGHPRVRACSACNKQVTFCDSVAEARALAQGGHCVAVDVLVPRAPGDLSEDAYVMVGRVAAGPRQPDAAPAVQPAAPGPATGSTITLSVAGRPEYRMTGMEALVGRAAHCDLVLDSSGVSREHARFTRVGDELFVEAFRTANGTFVSRTSKAPLEGRMKLEDGDEVTLGSAKLRVGIRDSLTPAAPPAGSPWKKLKALVGLS